eukprot:2113011-Rhodomonas_salina.3
MAVKAVPTLIQLGRKIALRAIPGVAVSGSPEKMGLSSEHWLCKAFEPRNSYPGYTGYSAVRKTQNSQLLYCLEIPTTFELALPPVPRVALTPLVLNQEETFTHRDRHKEQRFLAEYAHGHASP